jgi:hypothetical protein
MAKRKAQKDKITVIVSLYKRVVKLVILINWWTAFFILLGIEILKLAIYTYIQNENTYMTYSISDITLFKTFIEWIQILISWDQISRGG